MRRAASLIAMLALVVCTPALAQYRSGAAAPCPDREGAIFASGAGIVIGFLPRDEALTLRMQTEMRLRAKSNPAWLDNPRAVIRVQREFGASREIALVPEGMSVEIGEAVTFDGAHWDREHACMYVPNLIRKPARVG